MEYPVNVQISSAFVFVLLVLLSAQTRVQVKATLFLSLKFI